MRFWFLLIAIGLAVLPARAADPAPASTPDTATPPPPASAPTSTTATPPPPAAIHPAGKILSDGSIQDSLGFISVRPVPDATGELPAFLQRVEYLRKHGDRILAISYLRQIVTVGGVSPPYRARAMLELADCLAAEHQEAESLCWLKIWMDLYPSRPEVGAVAYRIGATYTQMGLPDMARDAFYLALAHTVNDGQVQTADDLRRYTELTVGTLWGLSANEYQSGNWERAAELFARFRKECPTANPLSLEKASYLQADCFYQLKQSDKAIALYEDTLQKHAFNPLAPQARLRLYHLYIVQKQPVKARDELESLAWTVRTVWPDQETYWQKQTAQMLLDLNKKNVDILPPLVQGAAALPPEGKSWQEALNHYDALVSYQAMTANATMDSPRDFITPAAAQAGLREQADLLQMSKYLNQLLPAPRTASTQ
jgi:tetratricopeptide (TPR) repeat protein